MSKSVSFSYLPTKLILVGSVLASLVLLVIIVVFGLNPNQPRQVNAQETIHPASLSSLSSGCGDIHVFQPEVSQYAIITEKMIEESGGLIQVPTHNGIRVPVYGYMIDAPLPESAVRFYEMDELEEPLLREQILRSMYVNDTIVVWYAKDIAPDDYQVLKEYVQSHDNILAVKWPYDNIPLPLDRKIGFSAWGISQTCEFWTDDTFETFTAFVEENRVGRPTEAPAAQFDSTGNLPSITFHRLTTGDR